MGSPLRVRSVLDLHGEWKSMPNFKAADLACVYGSHVAEKLDDLRFKLKLFGQRLSSRSQLRTKLDVPHRGWPWCEHQFTVLDAKELKATESELLHGSDERALCR
jgi:hypothetical protein